MFRHSNNRIGGSRLSTVTRWVRSLQVPAVVLFAVLWLALAAQGAPRKALAVELPPATGIVLVDGESHQTSTLGSEEGESAPLPTDVPDEATPTVAREASSPTAAAGPTETLPATPGAAPTDDTPSQAEITPSPTARATEAPSGTVAPVSSATPSRTPTPQDVPQTERWEAVALRDFAETVGWPPAVLFEAGNRMSVRKAGAGDQWVSASIRPFNFTAGANAAFAAEQEDARLAGYQLTQEKFYGFPAYRAVQTTQAGSVPERRFRWIVNSWVLGIDYRNSGITQDELQALSNRLLSLAAQNGLPVPPGSVDLPTATAEAPPEGAQEGCSATFSDVPPVMWARSYITELACAGIVSGYNDGSFRPQNPTTRAQLVKMVVLLEKLTLQRPSRPSFSDVGTSHPFYTYIETASRRGLIDGYVDGTFKPDAQVSRAQVAKIVVLARGWAVRVPANPAVLCDVPVKHWAYSYIQVAIGHGIFTGYGDGCFRPDDFATRAQLAKVLVLSHAK